MLEYSVRELPEQNVVIFFFIIITSLRNNSKNVIDKKKNLTECILTHKSFPPCLRLSFFQLEVLIDTTKINLKINTFFFTNAYDSLFVKCVTTVTELDFF